MLVTGLGPVGLAALMLARAMGADKLIGVEMNDYRIDLAQKLGLADKIIKPGEGALEEILEATGGHGAERAIDASANDQARQLAVRGTRDWGSLCSDGRGKLRKSSGYFLRAGKTNRKIYRNIILQKTGKTKNVFPVFLLTLSLISDMVNCTSNEPYK